jgi:hypothetical protein
MVSLDAKPPSPKLNHEFGRTTIVHFDHMNDYRGYTKTLCRWAKQLKLGGVIFLSLHCKPRPRHIFAVLDSSPGINDGDSATADFLNRLRTQNVDVNKRGEPCKERMSAVVAEFPLPKKQMNEVDFGELTVVETEGSGASQSHMPFVRDYLRQHRMDAESIISAMDKHLHETTKPGERR